MRKIIVTTSTFLLLLGVTLSAEANFFVSSSAPKANRTCNTNDGWQSPALSRPHCDAQKAACPPANPPCTKQTPTCEIQEKPQVCAAKTCTTPPPPEKDVCDPQTCTPVNVPEDDVCAPQTCPACKPAPACKAACPVPATAAPANSPCPNPAANPCNQMTSCGKVVAIVYEGSFKNNLERILRENGWNKIIWKLPNDYRWVGTSRICGPNLLSVVNTITESFPLEVTFYHANHVVTITPRTLHE